MTTAKSYILSKRYVKSILNFLIITLTILFSVTLSPRINIYVKDGLSLCFEAIIGSVFPFMIITDIISAFIRFEKTSVISRIFEKIFKVNGEAVSAFILGAICGFPVGVRVAEDMYKRKIITKEEYERLIGFSSNMGPAFVISGIGAALCKSLFIGIALYTVTIVSAVISGAVIGIGKTPSNSSAINQKTGFSITDSIKGAAKNTMNICGFVLFFSVICGLLSTTVKNEILYTFILPLLEVSNATKRISALTLVSKDLKLVLISFSVSFSGLSIFMQTKSFVCEQNISMKPYLITKLLGGFISAVLMTLILAFI